MALNFAPSHILIYWYAAQGLLCLFSLIYMYIYLFYPEQCDEDKYFNILIPQQHVGQLPVTLLMPRMYILT